MTLVCDLANQRAVQPLYRHIKCPRKMCIFIQTLHCETFQVDGSAIWLQGQIAVTSVPDQ